MPTYYEILKVAPDASVSQVDAACDTLYNRWRRLVTHHEPKVVDEANETLRQVEQIRSTLVDPVRRAAYDAGIGVGTVGGLADPGTILRQVAAPPSPRTVPPAPRGGRPCLQCDAMNGPKERYCGTCGVSLVRTCPECSHVYYVGQKVCGRCGYSYEVAEQRSVIQNKVSELQSQMDTIESSIRQLVQQRDKDGKPSGCLSIVCVLGAIFFFFFAGLVGMAGGDGAVVIMLSGLCLVLAVVTALSQQSQEGRRVKGVETQITTKKIEQRALEEQVLKLRQSHAALVRHKTSS